jgi:plastocyanin
MLASRLILSCVALGLLLCAPGAWAADHPITWTTYPENLLEIAEGDTVTFTVPGGHDLYRMPGQSEYEACDFTGATLEIAPGNIEVLTFDTPGVYYYACSIAGGFHCETTGFDMKITIVVADAVPSAAPGYVALALGLSGVAAAALVLGRRETVSRA